ncbi:hypothetical protein RRG08_028361 [Elysia crispata]|uniref:Uncharacterized protein n=1 Tax=Elysia crispata TaxID=231223 RepID=A0AAE1AYE5_9GAST|nr:hypothetical protein RRG08_028361 [Elysia crispata]
MVQRCRKVSKVEKQKKSEVRSLVYLASGRLITFEPFEGFTCTCYLRQLVSSFGSLSEPPHTTDCDVVGVSASSLFSCASVWLQGGWCARAMMSGLARVPIPSQPGAVIKLTLFLPTDQARVRVLDSTGRRYSCRYDNSTFSPAEQARATAVWSGSLRDSVVAAASGEEEFSPLACDEKKKSKEFEEFPKHRLMAHGISRVGARACPGLTTQEVILTNVVQKIVITIFMLPSQDNEKYAIILTMSWFLSCRKRVCYSEEIRGTDRLYEVPA